MNVKISKKGREIIDNKELASKVVLTVMNNKDRLQKGEIVPVDNENIGLRFVTTMEETTKIRK